MASFPTSVKAFATRNTGDTIQASHVDDLQDEVTAIEAGYLNATAPLNSSHSTLASLSVSGGSTFTGPVVFNGQVTFNSSVASSGGLIQAGTVATNDAQPRCRLFHSSTQTSANNNEQAVTFDSEDFDPQGLHSTASNPTRINLTSTGVWLLGGTVNFASLTGSAYIRLRKNGATGIGSAVGWTGAGSIGQRVTIHAIEVVTSTADYVELMAFHVDGFNAQLGNASSRIDQNEFYAAKLW